MKRNLFIITSLAAGLLVAACGSANKNEVNIAESAIAVRLQKVESSQQTTTFSSPAQIEASKRSILSTRVSGFVRQVHVKVGDRVSKNQLLVSLNNDDLMAQKRQIDASIEKAQEHLAAVEKDFNRFKRLLESKSVTEKEFDDVNVRFKMAQSDLELALQKRNEINAQFEYFNVKAPFSGLVTADFIDAGDLANPGAPLLTIEAQETLEVVTSVSESNISNINANTPVQVTIPALDITSTGRITEMSSSASQSGGQFLVKISLDATKQSLLPGMYAQVHFAYTNPMQANKVLIPESALVHKGQLTGVYTVSKEQKALLRWVRLGATDGKFIEVLSGLSTNESFIIDAREKLYNGATVRIQQ